MMQFKGAALKIREVVMVKLPRKDADITLKVASIPLGLKREYDALFPRPKPPVSITVKAGGKQEKEENWDDENFVKAFDEWKYLQNIYTFYRVLEADENVKFDHTPSDLPSLRAFANELKDSGISDGDLAIVLSQAAIASNITEEAIANARSSF